MSKTSFAPIHPGEILLEEYMKPAGLTVNALAIALRVTPARINEIIRENRGVTADMALRLSIFFETTPDLWMNLQAHYDLEVASGKLGELKRDIRPLKKTA